MPSDAFLPFARPEFDEQTISLVADVIRSHWVASGPNVLSFENELSAYLGGRPTRVMNSATAAIKVALQLCDIGPGDEVILPAQTFFAAGNMVLEVGATPVFVDVDLQTRNMRLDQTERVISDRTKALLPTHFNGLACDMDALYALAQKHHLRVIEDAALAIGSRWKGKLLGSIGDLVAFSFHPNKNMTSIEGGALVMNTPDEAKRCEALRFHGIVRKPDYTRDVVEVGGKFNMPDVNAAVGRAQLKKLDHFCQVRRTLADAYRKHWPAHIPALLPDAGRAGEENDHSWNMFCPLLPFERLGLTRAAFIDGMKAQGIGVGISYEVLHLASAFKHLGCKAGDFPASEQIANQTVSLPLFTQMSHADVQRVCATVDAVIGRAAP